MSTNAHILTPSGMTIFVDGQMHTVSKEHINFEAVKKAVIRKDWGEALRLADIGQTIATWAEDVGDVEFKIEAGLVYYKGNAYSPAVSEKVIRMIREGFDPAPLYAFLRKVEENPSASARQELLLFCEANNFAITEDGDILAYKAVRPDYTDKHTGKIDNSVGKTVTMERNKVDDRRHVTCSFGLHFAAIEYARGFAAPGDRIVVQQVHPKNVVSIPNDYNNQKGRCCEYTVIAELPSKEALPPQREVYRTSDFTTGAEVETALRGFLRDEFGVEVDYLGQDFDDLGLDSEDARRVVSFLITKAGVETRIDPWSFDLYSSLRTVISAVQDELEAKQREDAEDADVEDEEDYDDTQDDDFGEVGHRGGCGGY
jgi:hypothetical protein